MTAPNSRGLWRRNIVLMIVLTLVSFGLYYPFWFLRRRAALNGLDAPRKLPLWPFLIILAYSVMNLGEVIAFGDVPDVQTLGAGGALLLLLVRLAVGVLIIVQCFLIKDILEDHLAGPEDQVPSPLLSNRVQLSGLLTFLFGIFYLQHIINREIVDPANSTSASGAGPG